MLINVNSINEQLIKLNEARGSTVGLKKKSGIFKAFLPKPKPVRTKDEVDQEYSKEAILHGHKSRMLAQLREATTLDIEKLESEVEGHLKHLLELNDEGMKAQQAARETNLETAPQPNAQGVS